MKQHVFKPTRRVNGKRVTARTYSGRYQFSGDLAATQIALKVTDKQVAQAKLAGIVKQVELERQGLAAPRHQVETASAASTGVVNEWLADLSAKGRSADYVRIMGKQLGVLIRECGWKRIADISPDSFIRWRGANPHKAPKTLNEYLGAARALLNWLVMSRRLPGNPLLPVGRSETRGREVRNRRALTHEEFLRLFEVAGPVRSVVYAVAYFTGLRRAELESLRWGDFNLASEPPTVTIHAAHAKNKKTETLPINPDLCGLLVEYHRACGSPAQSARALQVPPRLKAFDADLAAAGIPKIDERGKCMDFHCLRHSCASRLAAAGVSLPVAMRLMRHSDPKLTAKSYVDEAVLPMVESVGKIPGLNRQKPSPIHSPESVFLGQNGSQAVATKGAGRPTEGALHELLSRILSHLGAGMGMAPEVGFEPTT
jgi:integrase